MVFNKTQICDEYTSTQSAQKPFVLNKCFFFRLENSHEHYNLKKQQKTTPNQTDLIGN